MSPNIEAKLALCARLVSLKSYRPRKRKAKRRFVGQRRRITKALKGATL